MYIGEKFTLPISSPGLHNPQTDISGLTPLMREIRNCDLDILEIKKREGTALLDTVSNFVSGNGGFEEGDFTGWTANNSTINSTFVDESCDSLSGYTNNHDGSGIINEVSPTGQFHLRDQSGTAGQIWKDWGTFENSLVFNLRVKIQSTTVQTGNGYFFILKDTFFFYPLSNVKQRAILFDIWEVTMALYFCFREFFM